MFIEIFDANSSTGPSLKIDNVALTDTVLSLKEKVAKKKNLGIDQISLRLDSRGKALKDEDLVSNLNLPADNARLYFRDLGPQIAWKTVFLCEYAGPLFVYFIFYTRPYFIYGHTSAYSPIDSVVIAALICHSFHYLKRLYETQFVHRFSNGTMPLRNIFKNCTYYWGFAAFMAYFINHPLYTHPMFGFPQMLFGISGFILCELGNYSIHTLLRDLRKPGTKDRKIPFPNANPLTRMYDYVSCPNYTYEVGSWICFACLTQCLPVVLFTLAGFLQMKIWAGGKHRAYKKESPNYPKGRTSIIPFVC